MASLRSARRKSPTIIRGIGSSTPHNPISIKYPSRYGQQCLKSFMEARSHELTRPANYEVWLHQAFGRVFADNFPPAYTRKYWTTEPANLGIDWIGARIYYPSVDDVKGGYKGPLGKSTYWVKKFRYPSRGGFLSFLRKLANGARLSTERTLERINFAKRQMMFTDATQAEYDSLVSTLPLPVLFRCFGGCARQGARGRRATQNHPM